MKTLIAACCICFTLTQQCLGDQTLFTCTEEMWTNYVAEGGQNKPGWEQKTSPQNVTKLIQTEAPTKAGGFFDIQVTTKYGVISLLKDCRIDEISRLDVLDLDKIFTVNCKTSVSTYLFYMRSGIPRLLVTHLSFDHAYTGAGVSISKPCKTGD